MSASVGSKAIYCCRWGESAPPAASFQYVACTVGDGVEVELRHVVYPERHAGDASGDDVVQVALKTIGRQHPAEPVLDLFRGDSLLVLV